MPVPITKRTGLSAAEAARRLQTEGANELPRSARRNFLRIVIDVLREPMFALLIGAGAIYLMLANLIEALVLIIFASGSVFIAVIQEQRGERALDALRDLSSPRALVIRHGARRRIPGREVVRGDAVVLSEGDRVPADARLVEVTNLRADEALLTGESLPVHKRVPFEGASTDGSSGRVFSGTLIVGGHGIGVVEATGANSETGKIGHALERIKMEPPRLQAQTRTVVRWFGVTAITVSLAVTALYGWLRGSWLTATLAGVAVGMSLLPRISPCADRIHGDGRAPYRSRRRIDAARGRDRNTWLCHGPMHG